MSTRALVVLSGGQDSTTCLYWARKQYDEIHAITFDYSQRHRREIDAAANIASMAGVASYEIITLGPILNGRSPLTSDAPLEQYVDHASMEKIIGDRVEKTFVPMRNALFLTLAANRAICRDILNIVTGVCQADNANYPDCRRRFIDDQQDTINSALGLDKYAAANGFADKMMAIETPLMDLSKAQSIKFALQHDGCYTALAYSHTAYDGAYPPTGKDHATILRAHGFEEAGVPDPLIVRAYYEGVMALPRTANYEKWRDAIHDVQKSSHHQNTLYALERETIAQLNTHKPR